MEEKRFDAHHKAESRGDLTLVINNLLFDINFKNEFQMFGSAAFMSVKLLLQIFELNFQRIDGFIELQECAIRVVSLTMIQVGGEFKMQFKYIKDAKISEWLQFLCLRRIMALHFEVLHFGF